MLSFRNTRFVTSADDYRKHNLTVRGEVVFVGRSNVGKSSLLNALCDHRSLAFTSSKPGHTKLLNYFCIVDDLYLVDAPGYGYQKGGRDTIMRFATMMEPYFRDCPTLKGILFLLDSRRDPTLEEQEWLTHIRSTKMPVALVITKCDKLNQKERAALKNRLSKYFPEGTIDSIILTSAKDRQSLEPLASVITNMLR